MVLVATSIAIELNCNFVFYSIDGYNCKVESFTNDESNRELLRVKGQHLPDKSHDKVDTLYFPSADCMTFLPLSVGKFFLNLKKLEVSHGSLKYITQSDFAGLNSLKTIFITKTLLTSIPEDTFNSLTNLEILILSDNKIRDLKPKTFGKLLNLRKVSLSENSLGILPSQIFEENLKIEKIDLSNNKLRVIEAETFNHLKNLRRIALEGNFCTSKSFSGDLMLIELELELTNKCSSDTEIVKSSTMTEMNHEILVLRQSFNASSEKMKRLKENLEAMTLKNTKIESENRDLINDVDKMRINSSIAQEENEDLSIKLNEAYKTIASLKDYLDNITENMKTSDEKYENLQEEYAKIEENCNELIENAISLRNESVETFESAESSPVFIKNVLASSSSLLIVLIVMVSALTGNILLIIVIIRVKRNKSMPKAESTEMGVKCAHDRQ